LLGCHRKITQNISGNISNNVLGILLTLLLPYFSVQAAESSTNTDEHHCQKAEQEVVFSAQPIFDESEKDTYFFHRWANWLHITTKIKTLKNETAFFLQDCYKTTEDLEEVERHLRSKKYLRDAKVTSDAELKKITVKTWDNWSLLPTISFSRKGGQNSYSWGIKERNLLGLGIYAKVESYKNTQRSGYLINSTIPLFQKNNTDLSLRFADNDDGKQKSVFLQKDFVSFQTNYAYSLGFNEELRNDTIFQNGANQSIYTHDISYKNASYSWLSNNNVNHTLRYRVGITQDKDIFTAVIPSVTSLPNEELPLDRDFLYPWLGIDYVEKEFYKLTNIHLITQIEDFNTGWQVNGLIGTGNGKKDNAAWLVWRGEVKKGITFSDNSLLLLKLLLLGDVYEERDTRLVTRFDAEYFYPFTEQWGFYLNNVSTFSQNQYLDKPISIGGNSGLRGFPLQYQHGEHSVKFTSEIRYYPNINIFKLADLAGAVFFDGGKAFGDSLVENIENNWLYSAGIGARLYSPHSSQGHQMIHIDLAFPISENPDIDSVEIRFQVKQAF
jgi:hypothetical protein